MINNYGNYSHSDKSASTVQKGFRHYLFKKNLKAGLKDIHTMALEQNIDTNNRFFGHGQIVGETVLKDKQNNFVKAVVSVVRKKGFKETYYIYADAEKSDYKKFAGFTKIVSSFQNKFINPYSDNSKAVFVDLMKAPMNDKYTEIGTKLHQIAIERSIQNNLNGRVFLNAAWNSHGFHYKSGFRASSFYNNEVRDKINKSIEKITPNTSFLGKVIMTLQKESFKIWQEIILKTPILK